MASSTSNTLDTSPTQPMIDKTATEDPSELSSSDAKTGEVEDPNTLNSHIPPLPVEVIERVLKCTFLRRSRLTPSSDPYHLNGTSHLLLVSKGFRELCLPFFYSSITISRPSHYATFFDPENGLFAGEEGARRWNLVKELSIVAGVDVPLVSTLTTKRDYLAALKIPEGHQLEALCMMDDQDPSRKALKQKNPPWVRSVFEDPARRKLALEMYEGDSDSDDEDQASKSERDEDFIKEQIWESLCQQISSQRAIFLASSLLPSAEPCQLRLSVETMKDLNLVGGGVGIWGGDAAYEKLHVFWSPPRAPDSARPFGSRPFTSSELAKHVLGFQRGFGIVHRVHLEEFPITFLDDFIGWFEASRKGSKLGIRRRPQVQPPARWFWDLPDGSVKSLIHSEDVTYSLSMKSFLFG